MKKSEKLIVTNFAGRLTRYVNGDINSGFAKYNTTYGNDPFSKPGNLTWMEQPTSILSRLITTAKTRNESFTTYVYGIDANKNLNKIQVNNTSTKNPNYDTSSILTTLTASVAGVSVPTFQYGPSLQFYGSSVLGASEKIFFGHDSGVSKVNTDGSGETVVTTTPSSIVSFVPRPSATFLGKTYWGNGNNLIEIDSTETVTSYARLNPGFPIGSYVRDLDITPDGNYLQIIVSKLNPQILNTTVQNTTDLSSAESYKFLWNGIDDGITAYETYNGYTINANQVFGQFNYTLGYDSNGAALYEGNKKIESLPNSYSPNFAATYSSGNMVGFISPEYDASASVLTGSLMLYGQYDQNQPAGLYRLLRLNTGNNYEVVSNPICLPVTNLFHSFNSANYTNNIAGAAKLYFSTFEIDNNNNNRSGLFKFTTVPTGVSSIVSGVYETQTELLGEKVDLSTVYIYAEPWVEGNQFKVEIIGSDNNPIPNSDYTFGVGLASGTRQGPLTVGNDYAWYSPNCKPTYAIGLRITNQGSTNYVIHKVEINYGIGGH